MHKQCSENTGQTCPSTTMCGRSRRKEIGPSISCAAASPAKTSALPERAQGSPVRGLVFGLSSLGSFAQFGPDGWSLKTSQLSLLEGSEPFSGTWPRSGLMRNGIAYRLPPLVRRIDVIGSGSLPTPTTKANQMCPSMMSRVVACRNLRAAMNLPTPSASGMPCEGTVRLARKAWLAGQVTLEEANAIAGRDVRDKQGKVPAYLADAVKRCPTPCATDWKTSAKEGQRRGQLTDPAMGMVPAGGQLNPTWVEWLMGFPLGWTALDASETPSSRKLSRSSGGQSSKRKND